MDFSIRDALVDYLHNSNPGRKLDQHLWISDLGYHPKRAVERLQLGELRDFDTDTLVVMDAGNSLEEATVRALRWQYPGVITQFPLFNEYWSGYADAIVGHGTADVTIVEHKSTGDNWWDYKQSIPRSTHICQLWLYGQLYEEMYKVRPSLVLYYRAWKKWAEVRIEVKEPDGQGNGGFGVLALGDLDGERISRQRRIAPRLLKEQMEAIYLEWQDSGSDAMKAAEAIPFEVSDWDYAENAYGYLIEHFPLTGYYLPME